MSSLTLEQLISLTNLSEGVKKDALANLERMNEEQKFKLAQIWWENIAFQYETRARFEYERMLEEMANGETQYSPEDFAGIEDRVMTELLSKIERVKTKEQIAEVQEELQKYLKPST